MARALHYFAREPAVALEQEKAAAAAIASSTLPPPLPEDEKRAAATKRYLDWHAAQMRSQANMEVHHQMLGPAYCSTSAPAQTWVPRTYMTPKADATALPDNREILILEDMTDEERRKYGINTYAAGAAALAPVGALRLPAEPPRLAPLPDHGLERGAPRIEMQRYATRRVLAWMLVAKDQRPVELRHVESCAVSTYAEFKLFNCAAPALDLPDDFPVVAYTTDDGSTLRLPSREFPHPDELFLVRVEDEWATPRLDRTTFKLREDASDSDSDDESLPDLESVDDGDDSPMPALEPDSPRRPTIVLVPAESWLVPAMTAFDEDRATPADLALIKFGNMYADVKYWATHNPAARCNNCVAICDAAAAYAAAVHAAAPPPPPPRAPKPMSAAEMCKAKVDAVMASHLVVSILPHDSSDSAPRPLSSAEMRKTKVDAIMVTNPVLRTSLLTPADVDSRANTQEDVHPAVAAFTPSAVRLQHWFRETNQAEVDAIRATAPALFQAKVYDMNDDSPSFPAAVLDRFCVRLADTEGMPDLSTLVMPATASEPRAEDEDEASPSLPVD
jgi:hypothetical protein